MNLELYLPRVCSSEVSGRTLDKRRFRPAFPTAPGVAAAICTREALTHLRTHLPSLTINKCQHDHFLRNTTTLNCVRTNVSSEATKLLLVFRKHFPVIVTGTMER